MASSMSAQHTPEDKYNVLMIGETGVGKSTLINYLTNFFQGGKLGQLRLSIPSKHYNATEGLEHFETNVLDLSKSQTSECMEYNFSKDGLIFGFIDTPGLNDTEGMLEDQKHISEIISATEEKGTLAAIMIVVNGTQSRATTNLRYTLNEMKNVIPDRFMDNIILVLTNCNRVSANFDTSQLKPWNILDENLFHMNNSALNKPEKAWKNEEILKKYVENEWNESMETIAKMIDRLKQMGSQSTMVFKEMRLKRNTIKSNLYHIMQNIDNLQTLQNKLEELTYQKISDDPKKYSDYKQTQETEYTLYFKSQFYSTICLLCSKVCYEDKTAASSVAGYPVPNFVYNAINFAVKCVKVALGGNSTCEKCNCSQFAHYDDTMKPIKKMVTVEKLLNEIKNSYDHRNDQVENKISGLKDDIAAISNALDANESAIRTCCKDLMKICSQLNLAREFESFSEIIQRKACDLRSKSLKNNAYDRIGSITEVIDEISGDRS
ncbi:AAEL002671-PA [Aedes aegypti]|uniref:AAEL002671-PA n=2 Tax=Aedes aegypti TaxID=7159 RepID=A0A1S4F2F4_AEDAE|nr:uncharacterized protein LOC5575579 [Aedes aegypti]EAT46128.1 AAEL002671-PA [Aedes aegypti]